MKKISLFIVMLCALSFVEVSAQKNVVRWSPLATVKMKAKVHYERALTDKLSAGAIGSYFFGAYPGFRIEPFARFYLTDEVLTGLYVQAKPHFSSNSLTVETASGGAVMNTYSHSFTEWGFAGNLGWQFMMGANKNISLDIFTGYRYSSLKALDNVDPNTLTQSEVDNRAAEIVYRALHSNLFDLGISLGYKY